MQELHTQNLQNQWLDTLQKTFGLKEFRGVQLEAIQTLMANGRLLCILPTGYGKSLLYQLPAYLLEGVTIVISPLLALMRDQIDHLNQRFKIPAMAINSDQTEEENHRAAHAALQGKLKILFIAPEQLDHVDRFNFLLNLNVSLVVVDEAHCISTWGHDFRPSYRQIIQFLRSIYAKNKNIKMLGLTATANKRVEDDIAQQLFFEGQKAVTIRQSLSRPNIHLSVLKTKGLAAKLATCEELLKRIEGCGLIYCATRENTELVADYLRDGGLNVTSYHAGYEVEIKRQLQHEFILDKYKALAATNALGMGIDKGNLRFIIHFDFPGSITAYYQEVGRCGRDGQKAEGVILFDPTDQNIHDYFIQSALPTPSDFRSIIEAIDKAPQPSGLNAIKAITGLHPTRTTIVIAELIEQGFIEKYSLHGKQVYKTLQKMSLPDLSRYTNQEKVKSHELKQMQFYGDQTDQCRMAILRQSLGDNQVENCQCCDCCTKKNEEINIPAKKLATINTWLNKRPVVILPVVKEKISAGISVLDSKVRSSLFINFMRLRAKLPENEYGIDPELLDNLKTHLNALEKKHRIAGIIPLPSRTWQARDRLTAVLAEHLQVPVLDMLDWKSMPLKRQGELFNNNQRHENVFGKMIVKHSFNMPQGTLLLLDDYVGSGNTLKEAARALRSYSIKNEIVPFTIAAVKWCLGKQGFV